MLAAQEREGSSRGRLDLLLEQLGGGRCTVWRRGAASGAAADVSVWRRRRHCSGAPGELPGRRPDQALRERPVGLVRSLLQIRQTLRPGDVDVEVLDVDVDLVRRRGQRIRSPDCPG